MQGTGNAVTEFVQRRREKGVQAGACGSPACLVAPEADRQRRTLGVEGTIPTASRQRRTRRWK